MVLVTCIWEVPTKHQEIHLIMVSGQDAILQTVPICWFVAHYKNEVNNKGWF